MSMNEFRRLAAKIDQHMQQLSAQGVNDPHAIEEDNRQQFKEDNAGRIPAYRRCPDCFGVAG